MTIIKALKHEIAKSSEIPKKRDGVEINLYLKASAKYTKYISV